jgi:hypothetical protein
MKLRRAAIILLCVFCCLYYAGRYTHTVTSVTFFQNISPAITFYSEYPAHPRLRLLLKKENIEARIRGLASDLEKASFLRSWVAGMHWDKNYPDPYPPWDALTILDWIRSGRTGGHCGQRGIIFGQACQALGIPVRYADLAASNNAGGHFTVEVYIKELRKWIIMDPTFDYSIKENDKLLSAREAHERLVGNAASGVSLDPDRSRAKTMDQLKLYYYYRYYLRNNFLSEPVAVTRLDHGKDGTEIVFNEKRLHLLDVFTSDKASRSSDSSGSAGDFDWPYRDLGITLKPGPMTSLLLASSDPTVKQCVISVNGRESTAALPFRVKLAGGRDNVVIVMDAGRAFGTIIKLRPVWRR